MNEILNKNLILKVENLVTRFEIRSGIFSGISGYVQAVDNISFDLKKGQTLSLVGESGCDSFGISKPIFGGTIFDLDGGSDLEDGGSAL